MDENENSMLSYKGLKKILSNLKGFINKNKIKIDDTLTMSEDGTLGVAVPVKPITNAGYEELEEEEKESNTVWAIMDDAASSGEGTALPVAGNPGQLIEIGTDKILQPSIYPSNPNLLDNWYFLNPINQLNVTEVDASGKYIIDRWFLSTTGTGKLTLDSTGITFETFTGGSAFAQRFEFLPPGTYTLSVLTTTDLYTYIAEWNGSTSSISDKFQNSMNIQISFSGGYPRFGINGGASPTLKETFIAAKVEAGSIQTLAHKEGDKWVLNDPPPNRVLELEKCQRYYQIFPSIADIPGGKEPTTSNTIKKEAFRPTMYSDITSSKYGQVSIDGKQFYYANSNL